MDVDNLVNSLQLGTPYGLQNRRSIEPLRHDRDVDDVVNTTTQSKNCACGKTTRAQNTCSRIAPVYLHDQHKDIDHRVEEKHRERNDPHTAVVEVVVVVVVRTLCLCDVSVNATQQMHLIMGAVSLWTRPPALHLCAGP